MTHPPRRTPNLLPTPSADRPRSSAASLATLLASLVLVGCNAQRDLNDASPAAERSGEAYRLSLQGQAAQRAGKTVEAIDLYRRAVELNPTMPGLWNNLGSLLMERQLYLDAVTAFKREIDLTPDDPRPYENLGLTYFQSGYAEDAVRYYEMALDHDPNRIESLRGLARVSRTRGIADDTVLQHLRRSLMIETDPTWRTFFESEKLRVENQVRIEKENAKPK